MNSQTLPRTSEHAPVVARAYKYWVLRYVPSVMRGEFVNVGVIVGAQDDWAMRSLHDLSGKSELGGDLRHCREWIRQLEEEVQATHELELPGVQRMSEVRLDRLTTFYNNSVQIAPGGPVAADSAEEAAELMFGLLVGQSKRERTQRLKTKMNRRFESALEEWSQGYAGRSYKKRPVIKTGRISEQFDFSLSAEALALTHTWPFTGSDPHRVQKDVRSWALSVQRLRHEGADMIHGKSSSVTRVPEDVRVGVLVNPPKSERLHEVFAEAEELWRGLDVQVYREKDERSMLYELTHA